MFEDSMITGGYSDYVESSLTEEVIERVINSTENTGLQEDVISNAENREGSETWGDESTLDDHFGRHGDDVGATDADDYASKANDLYNNREIHQVKVDNNGVTRVYDQNNNVFGSYNKNGTTRTLFSPKNGQGYFDGQPGISIFE